MEIYGYHPILKKRVEIGNSGIFRPEMLAPMVLLFYIGITKRCKCNCLGIIIRKTNNDLI